MTFTIEVPSRVAADLFISYAWTSDAHRQWVRQLAAHLKALGYDVLIDVDVDYGDSLTGFMRRLTESRHVLAIVDENYVTRADSAPGSGVAQENRWIEGVYDHRPAGWLGVAFKDNPTFRAPAWLADRQPKGFNFNADPASDDFPGSEQVEELWRWVEGLPANRDYRVSPATLRERAARLETIDRQRDPSAWSSPALNGEVTFTYERAPAKRYSLGNGEFKTVLNVSSHNVDSVYVLNDPAEVHAVGVNTARTSTHSELATQLSPGRPVVARVGDQVIIMNASRT